jgi:hypothetical protein
MSPGLSQRSVDRQAAFKGFEVSSVTVNEDSLAPARVEQRFALEPVAFLHLRHTLADALARGCER